MEKILSHIRSHRQQYQDELFQLLRIPSISTDSEHAEDVAQCAQTLAGHLKEIGMSTVDVLPTAGHPVVYAEWLEAADAPTVLVYGHYDVQPVDPLEQWHSPPFEPDIREGAIYARGASDDKGQLFAHAKAIEAYFKLRGRLPINLKLLFEGEEEIGSAHFHPFVEQHAERLQADVIIISDTSLFAPGMPTICYGTRGLAGCQIDLQLSSRDLHSGGFGGTVDNPVQVLAHILAALKDRNGRIGVPGFYDDVLELQDAEKQQFKALNFDEDAFRKSVDASELFGEPGYTTLERCWARPSLDINGISGGFAGEGMKTIIPEKAMAKITVRLVPNQEPQKILDALEAYIQSLTPPTVTLKISDSFGVKPYLTPLDHPVIDVIAGALKQVYGREPVFTRSGGTIGVLETFADLLQTPVVFVGFSQPDDNAHAPNEHLDEDAFYTGIEVAARLYNELQEWTPV
jgi:acetylornithine deacetylase/succinyl-diaminopimelate desuccinylase-like protein